jgi:hypothetical protein
MIRTMIQSHKPLTPLLVSYYSYYYYYITL